jgi:hypothetical protein
MRCVLILACLCAFASAAPADAQARARRAAAGLTEQIRGLLGEELKKGSFAGAVDACSLKAQTAMRAFAVREGIAIRRVSLKYRNPADAPDAWETLKLRELEEQKKNGLLPAEVSEVVTVKGRKTLRYLKPITIQQMCLTCHGSDEQIPADVKTILKSRYKNDKATGYQSGDLRGAVSVSVPLDATR